MTEQGAPDQLDRSLNSIILDIKSLMLLSTDEKKLSEKVTSQLRESHDDSVRKFVSLLGPSRKESPIPLLLTGLGELVLTSFLLLIGLSIVAPVLVGYSSPASLAHYFGSAEGSVAGSAGGAGLVMVLNLLLSVMLLFSAVYSLRRAASDLRESGLRM